MPSALQTQLENDLLAIESHGAQMAGTVTFTLAVGGASYVGTSGDNTLKAPHQDAGFLPEWDNDLIVRTSQFSLITAPANHDPVYIAGVTYRIEDIFKSLDGITQRWTLKKQV